MKRIFFCLMLGWLGIGVIVTNAADLRDTQKQLEAIRKRIEQAEQNLGEKQRTESSLSRDLAVIKRTLQRIDFRIKELRRQQAEQNRRIDKQQALIEANKKELRGVSMRLEKRLIALYKDGELGVLRVVFSANSPTELLQQYQYLTRILGSDRELLAEFRSQIETQQANLEALKMLRAELDSLLTEENQQRESAEQGRKLQVRLLKRVRADKRQLKAELTGLQEKASRLKTLLNQLEREQEQARLPKVPGAVEFTKGKRLAWPVIGPVLIGFGTQKDAQLGTIYESNGIEIAVPVGQPIKSVARGRVVFADWFKGYGNLLIVSHAGGYHTLYSHIDRLQQSVGDSVEAGVLLGYSGLDWRESIHFEIRQNGVPVNPLKWLEKR